MTIAVDFDGTIVDHRFPLFVDDTATAAIYPQTLLVGLPSRRSDSCSLH